MPDYQGNSKNKKETEKVQPKNIEKVVVSEVIMKKKSPGRKFKDLFIKADAKTVSKHVALEVLLPAAINMLFDAWKATGESIFYGEETARRRNLGPGPRVTYNNPINRGFRDPSTSRYAPAVSPTPRTLRHDREEFLISSREEAEMVLESMNTIIEQYEVVSIADLHELVGLPTNPVDNKWGWIELRDVQIRQTRDGYLIDFPQAEPMQ